MTPPRLLKDRVFVGAERCDVADLRRAVDHVLPAAVRSHRPPLAAGDRGRAASFLSRWASVCCRGFRRAGGQDWSAADADRRAGRGCARLCLDGARPGTLLVVRRARSDGVAGPCRSRCWWRRSRRRCCRAWTTPMKASRPASTMRRAALHSWSGWRWRPASGRPRSATRSRSPRPRPVHRRRAGGRRDDAFRQAAAFGLITAAMSPAAASETPKRPQQRPARCR